MAERIYYEFDEFTVDLGRNQILRAGKPIKLNPKPFELLVLLVQSDGQVLSKEELIRRIWPATAVSDVNFHVHLDAVRKALGETGRDPYYIIRTAVGYKFVADVREISATAQENARNSQTPAARLPSHNAHMITVGLLYGAYHVVSLLLEVTYQFDRYGRSALKIAPLVFVSMAITAMGSLEIDRRLTQNGRDNGLVGSTLCLLLTTGVLFWFMMQFLPPVPITDSALPTYPAQAAFLKNTTYIVLLAVLFVLLPFHFIVTTERKLGTVHPEALLSDKEQHLPYWSFWALAVLLLVFLIMSVAMTARLVDNLNPNPYHNLFVQLVYLRALLFFGLGIYCLAWYRTVLSGIKRGNRFAL